MLCKIVELTSEGWRTDSFQFDVLDGYDLVRKMQARGWKFRRIEANPQCRPSLQYMPSFKGLLGPMHDLDEQGDEAIRYETQTAYDRLSA